MGIALKFLRDLLKKVGLEPDRRTVTSLLVLIALLILLPLGLFLLRRETSFLPQAAGELIQLGEGGCIKLDKNKKKVVDCATVPLKLINPFYSVSGSTSAPSSTVQVSPSVPGASVTVSPSPSQITLNCPTSVSNGAELLTAVNCYKNAGTGGRIALPAGTLEVDKKVSVPSGVTIAGAGINSTTIRMSQAFNSDDALMANDSSHGQQNIVLRDFTLQGDGRRSGNSCCFGLKLQNISNSFVVNVGSNNFGLDGIYLGQRPNKPGASRVRLTGCVVNNNGRNGITIADGVENVIDHCTISGNSTNEPVAGIDIEPDNGSEASDNHIFANNISGNRNNGISITQNPHDPGGLVLNNRVCDNSFSGNNGTDFDDKGFNTQTSGCSDLGLNPPSAKAPTFLARIWDFVIGTVFAQDSDDVFTGASGSPAATGGTNPSANPGSNVLRYRLAESQAGLNQAQWREFVFAPASENPVLAWFSDLVGTVFAQDSDDVFTGTSGDDSDDVFTGASGSPAAGSSSAPVSTGKPTFSIGKQFITTSFQLTDTTPGTKQIWVQYMHPDGSTKVDHVTFSLVDKVPQITGLSCNLDISKQYLKITIDGNYFGTAIGTVNAVSGGRQGEVTGWTEKQITASLNSSGTQVAEGQKFQMKVVRPDGFESEVVTCLVGKSLISLGARMFCREPGKFDVSDVVVTLVSNTEGNSSLPVKVEEKVTINKDGEIQQLKTRLQAGKNYAVAIKAPGSLRRTAIFTASEGTTQITRPDGTPFILPVGDIAPTISPDGQINTLDRAELLRQWRILGATPSARTSSQALQTGDFNRDTRVNSIDWACMRYDFGSADDPIPVEVPSAGSGTITIPESASGTITIPRVSPTPTPTPRSSVSSSGSAIISKLT